VSTHHATPRHTSAAAHARSRRCPNLQVTAGAALAALLASACSSGPSPLPDAQAGRWVNPMGVTLDMAPTGIFTLEIPGKRIAVGRFTVAESETTFRFQLGSPFCAEEPGSYTLSELDGALNLSVIRDTCQERMDAFAKPFMRPATAPVASR
jgi:hypothetical protein